MADWAADRGLTPEPWAISVTHQTERLLSDLRFNDHDDSKLSLLNELIHGVPRGDWQKVRGPDRGLVAAHRHLSALVHPARPETIRLIAQDRREHPRLRLLGPLPIVRRLIATTIVLLVLFVLLAASPSVRDSIGESAPSTTSPSQSTTFSGR